MEKTAQLKAEVGAKKKRLAESEALYKKTANIAKEAPSRFLASENQRQALEKECAGLKHAIEEKSEEFAAKEEALNKTIEEIKEEASLQIEAVTAEREDITSKISQLKAEVDAKEKRLAESEGLYKKFENIARETLHKFQMSESQRKDLENKMPALENEINTVKDNYQKEKMLWVTKLKELEEEIRATRNRFNETEKNRKSMEKQISKLNTQILQRDQKIEMDTKYYKILLEEINGLREKSKS